MLGRLDRIEGGSFLLAFLLLCGLGFLGGNLRDRLGRGGFHEFGHVHDERDRTRGLAVGGALDVAGLDHGLELGRGHDVFELAVAERRKRLGFHGRPAGGQNHRAHGHLLLVAARGQGGLVHGRRAGEQLEGRVEAHLDPGIARHEADEPVDAGVRGLEVGVVHGEGLVEPRGAAAELVGLLHEDDLGSGAGRGQGGVHAGEAAAENQNGPVGLGQFRIGPVHLLHLDHAHAQVVLHHGTQFGRDGATGRD